MTIDFEAPIGDSDRLVAVEPAWRLLGTARRTRSILTELGVALTGVPRAIITLAAVSPNDTEGLGHLEDHIIKPSDKTPDRISGLSHLSGTGQTRDGTPPFS